MLQWGIKRTTLIDGGQDRKALQSLYMDSPWGHVGPYMLPVSEHFSASPDFLFCAGLSPLLLVIFHHMPTIPLLPGSLTFPICTSSPLQDHSSYPCLVSYWFTLFCEWMNGNLSCFAVSSCFLHKPKLSVDGLLCLLPTSCWAYSLTLTMKVTCSSKMSVDFQQTTCIISQKKELFNFILLCS